MLFSFFLILAVIGIVAGAVWTWKNKNMSKLKKAIIIVILAAGILIIAYASIFLILISADQAGYFTQGSNLGRIDYDRIISNAKIAGYEVDGPYYGNTKQEIGVHPSNIKELDERFGKDYRFLSVTSGTNTITKAQNFSASYSNLKTTSTSSNVSITSGEGEFTETFYNMDKKIGTLELIVPNVRIIFQDKGHEYTIKIDRLGGVAPEIRLAAREEIPKEEYRHIFKEMFVNLGLPPEKVDEFEFNYVPSVW